MYNPIFRSLSTSHPSTIDGSFFINKKETRWNHTMQPRRTKEMQASRWDE